jgi:(R)-2-hydroxyacyl-CoA dehydratese activating ATPase
MIVAGCDIGSTTGKAVPMKENDILSSAIVPRRPRPAETAEITMKEAMDKAGIASMKEFDCIIGTGYGRCKVAFANDNISKITCRSDQRLSASL